MPGWIILTEVDNAGDDAPDEDSLVVDPPEQAVRTTADAASATNPYPYRLRCIAHPSSNSI